MIIQNHQKVYGNIIEMSQNDNIAESELFESKIKIIGNNKIFLEFYCH